MALWFVLPGLVLTIVGWHMVYRPDRFDSFQPGFAEKIRARPKFAKFYHWFALVWTIISFSAISIEYTMAVIDLGNGKAQVAEGPVTNFVPMPYQGHAQESFDVQGRHFSYSSYESTVGFNRTASHGGPIHEGLNVRISYDGNKILKLEVAQ